MKEKIDCKHYDEELECCRKLSDWSQPMPVLQPCVESPCEYFESMSVNKQIDEMAQAMYDALPDDEHNARDCRSAAEEMYEQGYRKQAVGRWIYQEYSMGHYVGKCSLCDAEADMTKFCPSCGVLMKGE